MKIAKSVTLIESDSNDLGLEVKHETSEAGAQHLRIYRNSNRMAERRLASGTFGAPVFAARPDYYGALQPWVCLAIDAALDEGLRLLRDGRGLTASA
jgi:hypothetical protein